jgi:hypothetical protein
MKRDKRGPKSSPKQSLNLPDLDHAKSAVLNSLPSKESQRGYRHAMDEFIAWYCSEPRLSLNKAVVIRYRIHLESRQLAPGTINGRLAAVRRLAYEAADSGLLSPDLAAGTSGGSRGQRNSAFVLATGSLSTRPKHSGKRQTRIRSRASGIERCLESSLGAACVAKKRQNWRLPIFNGGRTTGQSSIWSARAGIFGPSPFRTGLKRRLIPGSHPLE